MKKDMDSSVFGVEAKDTGQPSVARRDRRPAYFTYDPSHGGLYYFAPSDRAAPPYLEQRQVTAILDIAADGTLAGVELVMGKLPPPPTSPQTVAENPAPLPNTDKSKNNTGGTSDGGRANG